MFQFKSIFTIKQKSSQISCIYCIQIRNFWLSRFGMIIYRLIANLLDIPEYEALLGPLQLLHFVDSTTIWKIQLIPTYSQKDQILVIMVIRNRLIRCSKTHKHGFQEFSDNLNHPRWVISVSAAACLFYSSVSTLPGIKSFHIQLLLLPKSSSFT
jgi:hypothetical protein